MIHSYLEAVGQDDLVHLNLCAKCKVKRRLYITDEEELSLTKYKTCDSCRKKNKLYKKNQKMKKLRSRGSMGQAQRLSSISGYDQTLPSKSAQSSQNHGNKAEDLIVKQQPWTQQYHNSPYFHQISENEASFELFLEKLSQNAQKDINRLKFKTVIPGFIVKRYENKTHMVDGNLIMSVSSAEFRVKQYKDEVKSKLKIHYLDRISDILLRNNYTFKIRSTNWKNGKLYSQMLCYEDVGNKKKDLSLLVEDDDDDSSEELDEEEEGDKNDEEDEDRRNNEHIGENNDNNDNNSNVKNKVSNSKDDSVSSSPSSSPHELEGDSEDEHYISIQQRKLDKFAIRAPHPVNLKIRQRPVVAQPRNSLMYPCQSRLNYSFDSASGQFNIEFNHLNHNGLPSTNPSDPKSILHPKNSPVSLTSEWMKQLKSGEVDLPSGKQGSSSAIYSRIAGVRVSGAIKKANDKSKKPTSAFADALNDLHMNISSTNT
ncbi:hypothetical protein CANARDRAFT_26177 [[Candida] arabinofermentans NRRL YB-2248]|uniref:Uncharacterized protein n=1 Tax=[Candida] arabinofermentans NRRL YB-2248 TaxID=983967 RepID=A0A1E4T8E4_9ASCO|nr:hypothetical protein CANARDRAFT_26177 [[Candida] arabinofermentans NRRL YB-2248]